MATPPLGISKPVSKDDAGATALRERIKQLDFQKEYADLLAKDGSLKSVAQILQGCCSLKSVLRPPAAFVAERLFDALSSGVMALAPSFSNLEAAKSAVSLALGTHGNKSLQHEQGVDDAPQPSANDLLSLEQAHDGGDPVASALIGQAIWKGLKATATGASQVLLARGRDTDESKDADLWTKTPTDARAQFKGPELRNLTWSLPLMVATLGSRKIYKTFIAVLPEPIGL